MGGGVGEERKEQGEEERMDCTLTVIRNSSVSTISSKKFMLNFTPTPFHKEAKCQYHLCLLHSFKTLHRKLAPFSSCVHL